MSVATCQRVGLPHVSVCPILRQTIPKIMSDFFTHHDPWEQERPLLKRIGLTFLQKGYALCVSFNELTWEVEPLGKIYPPPSPFSLSTTKGNAILGPCGLGALFYVQADVRTTSRWDISKQIKGTA
jgi:hypothetical protein